jgi:hypothetical protein
MRVFPASRLIGRRSVEVESELLPFVRVDLRVARVQKCPRSAEKFENRLLGPTNLIENKYFVSYENWNESLDRGQVFRSSSADGRNLH